MLSLLIQVQIDYILICHYCTKQKKMKKKKKKKKKKKLSVKIWKKKKY